MTKTVAALFDSYDEAAMAVAALEDAGLPPADISLISNNIEKHYDTKHSESREKATDGGRESLTSTAATGAGIGSLLGGSAGLLAGLGIVVLPGIGSVAAAGWLATMAVGAATGAAAGGVAGGLVGALTRSGIAAPDADVYVEGIRRGCSLVSVKCDESRAEIAHKILDDLQTFDINARAEIFRDNGWRQFDAEGRTQSEEELSRARQDPRMPVL
jgi:hypothetical protein